MAAEKTKALTIQTFVDKVMSPILNELSRFVRFSSRVQLSFNFMAAVTVCSDFGAQENKISHCFHLPLFTNICHEVIGVDAVSLGFLPCVVLY